MCRSHDLIRTLGNMLLSTPQSFMSVWYIFRQSEVSRYRFGVSKDAHIWGSRTRKLWTSAGACVARSASVDQDYAGLPLTLCFPDDSWCIACTNHTILTYAAPHFVCSDFWAHLMIERAWQYLQSQLSIRLKALCMECRTKLVKWTIRPSQPSHWKGESQDSYIKLCSRKSIYHLICRFVSTIVWLSTSCQPLVNHVLRTSVVGRRHWTIIAYIQEICNNLGVFA